MRTEFAEWLQDEMRKRGWSQADLARAAGIPRQVISTYINRQRQRPSTDVLTAIAKAFDYPPEHVFRKAGILPPKPETDERLEELVHLIRQLPEEDQERVLAIAQAMVDFKRRWARKHKRGESPA